MASFCTIHRQRIAWLPWIGFVSHRMTVQALPAPGRIGFVSHICPMFTPLWFRPELASFPEAGHRGDVAQSARQCRVGGRRIGFVLHIPLSGGVVPDTGSHLPRYPSFPQFGFVFPNPIAGTIYHNSFPDNHLPLLRLGPKLALFWRGRAPGASGDQPRQIGFVSHDPHCVFQPATGYPFLASFDAFRPRPRPCGPAPPDHAGNWVRFAQSPVVPCPSGRVPPGPAGNWLCFAQSPSGRNGGTVGRWEGSRDSMPSSLSRLRSSIINHQCRARLGAECLSTLGPCCTNRTGILCTRGAATARNSLRPIE